MSTSVYYTFNTVDTQLAIFLRYWL